MSIAPKALQKASKINQNATSSLIGFDAYQKSPSGAVPSLTKDCVSMPLSAVRLKSSAPIEKRNLLDLYATDI